MPPISCAVVFGIGVGRRSKGRSKERGYVTVEIMPLEEMRFLVNKASPLNSLALSNSMARRAAVTNSDLE